jgi:twitching motility protein PilT
MAQIDHFLEYLVENEGSDLQMFADQPPYARVHGSISRIDDKALSSSQILAMLKEIMPPQNYTELIEELDTDCAYEIKDVARFRVNGFKDHHGFGTVLRLIPSKIPTFDDLKLPHSMLEFCYLSKGLVIVTGPTGSGKSTTLAAMINYINETRNEHIITIEDPIEFVHNSRNCVINQREVHRDTSDFTKALRAALREDPDIILLGEIRDLETMETALECAETGHLVFATLHTNSAIATVDRIIDKFPANKQNQIRTMLADTLSGVVAQTLCKKLTGGRIAIFEILKSTSSVAALIREAKTHMLNSVIQTSRKIGMQSFNDELTHLAANRVISAKEAYFKAIDKIDIENRFRQANISLRFRAEEEQEAQKRRIAGDQEQLNLALQEVEKNPEGVDGLVNAAWIQATSIYNELRDGKSAVKLASRACDIVKNSDPHAFVVLGAAYAETGNFRKAIHATRKAIDLYKGMKYTEEAEALQSRIELFQSKRPYRND